MKRHSSPHATRQEGVNIQLHMQKFCMQNHRMNDINLREYKSCLIHYNMQNTCTLLWVLTKLWDSIWRSSSRNNDKYVCTNVPMHVCVIWLHLLKKVDLIIIAFLFVMHFHNGWGCNSRFYETTQDVVSRVVRLRVYGPSKKVFTINKNNTSFWWGVQSFSFIFISRKIHLKIG